MAIPAYAQQLRVLKLPKGSAFTNTDIGKVVGINSSNQVVYWTSGAIPIGRLNGFDSSYCYIDNSTATKFKLNSSVSVNGVNVYAAVPNTNGYIDPVLYTSLSSSDIYLGFIIENGNMGDEVLVLQAPRIRESGGGGGLGFQYIDQLIESVNISAGHVLVQCPNVGSTITEITLPNTPVDGDTIWIKDTGNCSSSNKLRIYPDTLSSLQNYTSYFELTNAYASVKFLYYNGVWYMLENNILFKELTAYTSCITSGGAGTSLSHAGIEITLSNWASANALFKAADKTVYARTGNQIYMYNALLTVSSVLYISGIFTNTTPQGGRLRIDTTGLSGIVYIVDGSLSTLGGGYTKFKLSTDTTATLDPTKNDWIEFEYSYSTNTWNQINGFNY